MPFNSFEYLFFFIFILIFSWLFVGFHRFRTWFLLGASLYFYYSNNHWQTLLLLFTITIDYFLALEISKTENEGKRRFFLAISLVSNLGMLIYFKYFNFFGESVSALAKAFGIHLGWIDLNIILPVGISFYTFEALSYMIDVYQRKISAEPRWHKLAFLVSFFPHLIAGPIVRASDFFPQMNRPVTLQLDQFEEALYRIFTGLFKKLVLADWLALYADQAFGEPYAIDSLNVWIGVYAFAFQIYFDFSGYTDIALGSAKLLGYKLPENFCRPYSAKSITDFWHRWHISLSTWLRDYLYIALLGGNRMKTHWGTYRNLMITMFLGGLWHGAAWHFALWGCLHGVLLSIEKKLGVKKKVREDIPSSYLKGLALQFMTFNLLVWLWIPFRCDNLTVMVQLIRKMFLFEPSAVITRGNVVIVAFIFGAWCWQVFNETVNAKRMFLKVSLPIKGTIYGLISLSCLIFSSSEQLPFIYFRF